MIVLKTFSQSGINDTLMCLPTKTFRAIAKELIRGDSAIAMLKVTNDELVHVRNLIQIKDSMIVTLTVSDLNNKSLINDLYDNNQLLADEIEHNRNRDLKQSRNFKNLGITAFIFLVFAILK